jgi:hypothetical protein
LSEKDLQAMLDAIAKATKAGDMAQAQRLLDELQNVMENLQPAQGGGSGEGAKALSELDRLTREQQQLRDETFQRMKPGDEGDNDPNATEEPGQNGSKPGLRSGAAPRSGRQQGARPERGQSKSPSAGESEPSREAQRQQALRERLEQLQDTLKRAGEESSAELGEADKAMKEAEESLKRGGEGQGKAVDAQGRALQALRRGAAQLASRMKNGGQPGGEEGPDGETGQPGQSSRQGRGGDKDDPLGRPSGMEHGYDPNNVAPALRARRVQDEVRRRLGQPERPTEELDYLQRLLRRR